MIRAEYIRFLQTLNTVDMLDGVRKIANIVLQHLDELIPLSTVHGQRIKKVVRLAQENWRSVSSDIQPLQKQTTEQACFVSKLKKLSVCHFRGFSQQEDFDLGNRLVLAYGPNGTGKSSFCEALEYGLLGAVAEAENKRFRNQEDYLKNAHTKNFTPPTLVGVDNKGNEVSIVANEDLFRFCFVEKTRIDSFSRIAAQTPSKQSELISTLFGLDAYTEFVRNFTEAMDGKYIDLEGAKANELEVKRQMLVLYQQQLNTIAGTLQEVENDEKVLANGYRQGCAFDQMVTELRGSADKAGLIEQLENAMQRPLTQKKNLTIVGLCATKDSVESSLKRYNEVQLELSNASQQVSFKQLYDAVVQLKGRSDKKCPACQTPLSQVAVDPFEHAEAELKTLEHLGLLQESIKTLGDDINASLSRISGFMNLCCTSFPENNPLSNFKPPDSILDITAWWDSLHQKRPDGSTPWQHVENQVQCLEDADKEIGQAEQVRNAEQAKLKQLREFNDEIVRLQTRRESAVSTKKKAQEEIEKFDTENAQLIADVEAEKTVVIQNRNIAEAYKYFVQQLNAHKDNLPAQLVTDLGEMVVQLYNAFNRNDVHDEQLSTVHLPTQQNQRLEISFKKNPDSFFDALHVLSEGHIRCLGLAILTAKNIKENCPFLIFDDPVNAIDDDHRESIRLTLFEDDFFNDKQIVLTCHGEEFFKDIQNLLPVAAAKQSKILSFLPKIDDLNIRVDHNCYPRNYIILARSHYDQGEIREALGKSRMALESLTKEKIWRYVSKYGDANLSIKKRSATAPIELRNLTEQLSKQISKDEFSDRNKT